MSNEPINATSLDDLAPPIMEITIPRPDGREVIVKLKGLTEDQLFQLRKSIVWPKPPISGYKSGGIPILDYADSNYVKANEECNNTLACKAILMGLQLEVPGETEEDKLSALKNKMGNYAFQLLVEASNRLNLVGQEEIAAVARSFRYARGKDTPAPTGAGLDAQAMAEFVAG